MLTLDDQLLASGLGRRPAELLATIADSETPDPKR
jgi:hypothetical protein